MPKGGKGKGKGPDKAPNAASKAVQQSWYLVYGGVIDNHLYNAGSVTKKPGEKPGKRPGINFKSLKNSFVDYWATEQITEPFYNHISGGTYLESNNATTRSTGVIGFSGQTLQDSGGQDLQAFNGPSLGTGTFQDTAWSHGFWVKADAGRVGETVLSAIWRNSLTDTGDRQWRIQYNTAADGFDFSVRNGAVYNAAVTISTGDISLSTGTWYHIYCDHDPVADEIGMTISTIGSVGTRLTATLVGGCYQPGTPNKAWYMGRDLVGGNKPISSPVDEIFFGNRIHTSAELEWLVTPNGYADILPTSAYDPGMMSFAAAAYYSGGSGTHTGNFLNLLFTFNVPTFTGSSSYYQPFIYRTNAGITLIGYVFSSDYSDAEVRNKIVIQVFNNTDAVICQVLSNVDYCAATKKSFFFSYDATAGTLIFEIDGSGADDTGYTARVAPTTGTLYSGAGARFTRFGQFTPGPASSYGFIGADDTYQSTPTDFFDGANPKELDQSGWTEFGAQPLFWNQYGDMTDNKGSAGNMTTNGTITGPSIET